MGLTLQITDHLGISLQDLLGKLALLEPEQHMVMGEVS
jgi:hypothetical protein